MQWHKLVRSVDQRVSCVVRACTVLEAVGARLNLFSICISRQAPDKGLVPRNTRIGISFGDLRPDWARLLLKSLQRFPLLFQLHTRVVP